MHTLDFRRGTIASAVLLLVTAAHQAGAQTTAPADPAKPDQVLEKVVVRASADASAGGLKAPFAGGQVARGGRVGILGNADVMDTPISITAYTNELIQDRIAKSVGDVLQNDPTVRMARGFGNFQEAYFIRGFILGSDDVAYNGLYSLLPRQYIATELFERVELVRGASAFLNGANPGGGGIGGAINLLPKRATNEPLTRVTAGWSSDSQYVVSADVSRRFGPDNATGVRVNLAQHGGDSAVDDENAKLSLAAIGLDWHNRNVRLSGDLGWQENKLKQTRPNVSIGGLTAVPGTPDADVNFAQPWSYSNERDLFGTLRGEWDITDRITGWAAYGFRSSSEANSLANLTVTGSNGDGNFYRFDNTRKDKVDTGELGVRGKLATGPVNHEWVVSLSTFQLETKNAYEFDFLNAFDTNLYNPVSYAQPAWSANAFGGGALDNPNLTNKTKLSSLAVGDSLGFLDDTVKLTLGLRNQRITVENYDYGTAVQNSEYSESRVSPMVGLLYKLSKQVSLYGNYIEGLTKGDVAPATNNGGPVGNAGQTLKPYVSKQKEIGVKFDAGRIGGGIALFSTTKPRSVYDASNTLTDGGEDRHQGAEVTVYGKPLPSVKLLGGVTWLDAIQKSTGSAATDGKRVIGVPRTQASLGAEWAVTGLEGLALDARAIYTGASYADSLNTLEVPGWTRFDLGARYEFNVQDHLVTVRARVDNVADRSYWASAGGYPENGYLVVGSPRTFSLSASIDY